MHRAVPTLAETHGDLGAAWPLAARAQASSPEACIDDSADGRDEIPGAAARAAGRPTPIERAYIAGPGRNSLAEPHALGPTTSLVVERAESDSGNFFIPCAIEGHGELMLSTASLMERDEPYHLQVELARGTINRLRNQIGTWEVVGHDRAARPVRAAGRGAMSISSWAATRQDEPEAAAERAAPAIGLALDAIDAVERRLCRPSAGRSAINRPAG